LDWLRAPNLTKVIFLRLSVTSEDITTSNPACIPLLKVSTPHYLNTLVQAEKSSIKRKSRSQFPRRPPFLSNLNRPINLKYQHPAERSAPRARPTIPTRQSHSPLHRNDLIPKAGEIRKSRVFQAKKKGPSRDPYWRRQCGDREDPFFKAWGSQID